MLILNVLSSTRLFVSLFEISTSFTIFDALLLEFVVAVVDILICDEVMFSAVVTCFVVVCCVVVVFLVSATVVAAVVAAAVDVVLIPVAFVVVTGRVTFLVVEGVAVVFVCVVLDTGVVCGFAVVVSGSGSP